MEDGRLSRYLDAIGIDPSEVFAGGICLYGFMDDGLSINAKGVLAALYGEAVSGRPYGPMCYEADDYESGMRELFLAGYVRIDPIDGTVRTDFENGLRERAALHERVKAGEPAFNRDVELACANDVDAELASNALHV